MPALLCLAEPSSEGHIRQILGQELSQLRRSIACHTKLPSLRGAKYGQGWIRTSEGVKPADLHL
jgi:hypothetical protein